MIVSGGDPKAPPDKLRSSLRSRGSSLGGFRVSALQFTAAAVDGKFVKEANYTSEAGRIVVNLKASYLETLSEGEHTITIQYTDGETEGTFTVKAAAAEETTETQTGAPATGDEMNLVLWSVLMGLSVLGMAVLLFGRRRRSEK